MVRVTQLAKETSSSVGVMLAVLEKPFRVFVKTECVESERLRPRDLVGAEELTYCTEVPSTTKSNKFKVSVPVQ